MARWKRGLWAAGVVGLAAIAAQAGPDAVEAVGPPVEAPSIDPVPSDRGLLSAAPTAAVGPTVPGAENVETVLRATYMLPAGRGQSLAVFLQANAAPGIDVRFENDRLTVVAPEDAQRALGTFIERCLSTEPAPRLAPGLVPNYESPSDDGFRPVPESATFRPASDPPASPRFPADRAPAAGGSPFFQETLGPSQDTEPTRFRLLPTPVRPDPKPEPIKPKPPEAD